MSTREPVPRKRVFQRRRKRLACDSCHKKKIQCDRASPKCNYCHHHSLPCTFTQGPAQPKALQARAARQPKSPPLHPQGCPKVITIYQWASRTDREADSTSLPDDPTSTGTWEGTLHFPGLAFGNICAFNGLPFFSSSGRDWIRSLTGEEVNLKSYSPPRRMPSLSPLPTLGYAPSPAVALPSRELLYGRMTVWSDSVLGQIFPFIEPTLFKSTIHAAHQEESPPTGGAIDSRACVFAFMAISSILPNVSQNANVNGDEYASEAYRLLPDLLRELVTVDGLQALLLLCFYSQAIVGDLVTLDLLLSSATRFVFHLGGHIYPRKPDGSARGPSTLQLHVRILFWLCYSFNQESSSRTGLPPNLDDANCDLTLPSAFGQNDTMSSCSPVFIPFIRLAMIQSRIFRELYSISALNKTDVELFSTIRDLDGMLEEWKLSIPEDARPTFTDRPTDAGDMACSIFQLMYHYCMATIHQASGRCISWTQNQDTRGLGSSLAISVEASRSLLRKFCDSHIQFNRFNLLFCLPYFTGAMIHLFCNALLHPIDPSSRADLELMQMVPGRMMAQVWPNAPITLRMQVEFVSDLSLEMQRLVRTAIRKSGG